MAGGSMFAGRRIRWLASFFSPPTLYDDDDFHSSPYRGCFLLYHHHSSGQFLRAPPQGTIKHCAYHQRGPQSILSSNVPSFTADDTTQMNPHLKTHWLAPHCVLSGKGWKSLKTQSSVFMWKRKIPNMWFNFGCCFRFLSSWSVVVKKILFEVL